jgi:hypothetical protein
VGLLLGILVVGSFVDSGLGFLVGSGLGFLVGSGLGFLVGGFVGEVEGSLLPQPARGAPVKAVGSTNAVADLGQFTQLREEQPLKAPPEIKVNAEGRLIVARAVQSKNVALLIELAVAGHVKVFKEGFMEKAEGPMDVTPAGTCKDAREVH